MEDIINRIKKGASIAIDEAEKFTKNAVDATKNVIDRTKLSCSISDLEGRTKDILALLGQKLYDEYCDGAEFDGEIKEYCEKIDELKSETDEIKQKIADMKNSSVCDECGELVKADAMYCPKCGRKLKDN